jgi:hypothetical protein
MFQIREVCEMQDAETVLNVLRERGRSGLPCTELYRQLFNPSLYELSAAAQQAWAAPFTPAGHQALPWAIARQPLWGIGGWVVVLDDQRAARAHARATFPAIGRALDLVADISA